MASASVRIGLPARARRSRATAARLQLGVWLALLACCIGVAAKTSVKSYHDNVDLAFLAREDAAKLRAGFDQLGISVTRFGQFSMAVQVLSSLAAIGIGWILIRRARGDWFVAGLACVILAQAQATYPPDIPRLLGHDPAWMFVARLLTALAIGIFFVVPFLFPDGRIVPRWAGAGFVTAVLGGLGFIFLPNADLVPSRYDPVVSAVTTLLVAGTALGGQVVRYRRYSNPVQRQQTKWVVFGVLVAIPLFFTGDHLLTSNPGGVAGPIGAIAFTLIMPVAFLAIPVTLLLAIMRYRLYDIDLVISRTLVWLLMTAAVVLAYVGVVLGLGALLDARDSLLLSLVATGVVAVAFQPVKSAVQRRINRLLFGDRDDPYAAVSRLGDRMAATLRPDELLPAIVQTVTDALRLPYAAIFLAGADGLALAAAAGSPARELDRLPLVHQGERIGELHVAPRSPGETFGPSDRRVLEELARQIGVAAHAARLSADLQRSRERIVIAREEERQRLRRDLHDGLGAQLAALAVQANRLRGQIARDPAEAERTAVELRAELKAAIADIRTLVLGLRPPALDELGLAVALEAAAGRYRSAGTDVPAIQVRVDELPPLPAAVEVAVYRITDEALANVVKHAAATRCDVRVGTAADGWLALDVSDDGRGLPVVPGTPGFGLTSMRERAEELGGRFAIGPGPDGRGTRVHVRIPLARGQDTP